MQQSGDLVITQSRLQFAAGHRTPRGWCQ
jgi:hypothetical protein